MTGAYVFDVFGVQVVRSFDVIDGGVQILVEKVFFSVVGKIFVY